LKRCGENWVISRSTEPWIPACAGMTSQTCDQMQLD
jgi:hypothetical protein